VRPSIPRVAAVSAAAAVAVAVLGCTTAVQPRDGVATVTAVVDGDTIDVSIDGRDERVRLIGIDTPETKKPDAPIECFGPEASEFTTGLLPVGTEVRIERDIVGRDDYGRLLGYVHRLADGLFVNLEIVEQGFAQLLTIEPNSTFSQAFAAAAIDAERADRGLWAACTGPAR
jgi:micrococcal nuclease